MPVNTNDLMGKVAPKELPLHCAKCGNDTDAPALSLVESNHAIRAECPSCGRYIKFVKQRSCVVSKGFVERITSWIPRLQKDDLAKVKVVVDNHISHLN